MEDESAPLLSRKELRKQKLMEYLAAKGRRKLPNVTPYLECQNQAAKASLKVAMEKENKAPLHRFKGQNSNRQTVASKLSEDPRRRGALGVSKENVEDGKRNASSSSSSKASAQTKVHQNSVLRRTFTVSSSRSNKVLERQPNTGGPTLSQVEANGRSTRGAKADFKSSLRQNRAPFCPLEMASSRISSGPLVKTKTGLVPAVIQPRNAKSNVSNPPAARPPAVATAANASRGQWRLVSVSQTSASVLSSSSGAGSKTEAQGGSKPKPISVKPSQPTGRSQLSGGLRLTAPPKCKTVTVTAEPRVLSSKSAGQPAETSAKTRPQAGGKKSIQSVNRKTEAPTASRTSSQCGSTAGKTNKPTVVPKGVEAAKTSSKEKPTRAIPSVHASAKRPVPPVGSKTAPQPCRSISVIGRAPADRTPKVTLQRVPQTEGKKLTSAQEERMRKLQEWRETKGISYKRPPMPVRAPVTRTVSLPQPFWAEAMKMEDDARSLICAVDRSLDDCIKLLAEGCPPDQVKGVLSRLPALSQKFAKYWICRARLMEQEGNLDVLPVFEEAVGVVLEPVDELRTVVFDILKKKDEIQENEKQEDDLETTETSPEDENNPLVTPKPVKALIKGERRGSSVVKYKITATPGGPPSTQTKPVRVNGQEVRFFTPVRRSVRIERASLRYPQSLQDHDVCVRSYSDLISEEAKETSEEPPSGAARGSGGDAPMYIYRPNEALGDKVSVELILHDSF